MDISLMLYLMKVFVVITTPITFLVGIFLLYDFDTYMRIEKVLSKSYFFYRVEWLEKLEKNRYSLQSFLLKRRRIVGLICLANAIVVLFANLHLFRN